MIAVRYYSKTGNTEKIANAIAESLGVQAVSVLKESVLDETVDILFLGGAPYANIMAPELRKYAEGLTADKVHKVVLFTTSNWSRRTVRALRKIIGKKGIPVEEDYFYAHMLNIKGKLDEAKEFAERHIKGME